MRGVGIVRNTVIVSVALASIAFLIGLAINHRSIGLGLAVGLILGASNGELIQRVIDSRSPFLVSSVLRMAGLSAVAIFVAFVVGASPIALLLGVAGAQLVMVGAAIRQGLRT